MASLRSDATVESTNREKTQWCAGRPKRRGCAAEVNCARWTAPRVGKCPLGTCCSHVPHDPLGGGGGTCLYEKRANLRCPPRRDQAFPPVAVPTRRFPRPWEALQSVYKMDIVRPIWITRVRLRPTDEPLQSYRSCSSTRPHAPHDEPRKHAGLGE